MDFKWEVVGVKAQYGRPPRCGRPEPYSLVILNKELTTHTCVVASVEFALSVSLCVFVYLCVCACVEASASAHLQLVSELGARACCGELGARLWQRGQRSEHRSESLQPKLQRLAGGVCGELLVSTDQLTHTTVQRELQKQVSAGAFFCPKKCFFGHILLIRCQICATQDSFWGFWHVPDAMVVSI